MRPIVRSGYVWIIGNSGNQKKAGSTNGAFLLWGKQRRKSIRFNAIINIWVNKFLGIWFNDIIMDISFDIMGDMNHGIKPTNLLWWEESMEMEDCINKYGNLMGIWGCNDYVTYKQQDDSLGVSENWLAGFKRKSDDKHYNWSTMKYGMPIFRQVHLVSFDDQYHSSRFQLVWGWLWC